MTDQPLMSWSELREICNRVIDGLVAQRGDLIDLRLDHYWSMTSEARYDLEREPTQFTVGQLSDDLDNLRRILADEFVLSRALVWLGNLLQGLGEGDQP